MTTGTGLAADPATRPLRICFVSADYLSDWSSRTVGVGGIGTHTFTLAGAVANLGHEVTVLTERGEAPWQYREGNVSVHALPPTGSRMWKLGRWIPVSWLRRAFRASRALRDLHRARAFDMVRFADGNGEGFLYSFSPAIPFDVHLMGPATVLRAWDGPVARTLRFRLEQYMERRPAAAAPLLTSATKRFADYMSRAWRLDPSRIEIIRNPLNVGAFRPDGGAGAGKVVLFASILQRRKGVHTLAAAMPEVVRRHPEAEFWFLGRGTRTASGRYMREVIQEELAERGVLDRARFLESVHPRELTALYRRAAVLALPALNDVFPNVALEAMACATPCVLSTHTGVDELILDGESGMVVPPEDPPALATALCRVLALPPGEREAMGRRAREAVARACDASAIAAQTVERYRHALEERRAGSPTPARS